MLSRDLIDYIFSHNEDASLIRELQHLFDKNENAKTGVKTGTRSCPLLDARLFVYFRSSSKTNVTTKSNRSPFRRSPRERYRLP